MMRLPTLLAASLLAISPAAAAQSIHETHAEVRMPVGKTVRLYRPLARPDCGASHRHHQAGKGQMPAVDASAGTRRCAPARVAAQDVAAAR